MWCTSTSKHAQRPAHEDAPDDPNENRDSYSDGPFAVWAHMSRAFRGCCARGETHEGGQPNGSALPGFHSAGGRTVRLTVGDGTLRSKRGSPDAKLHARASSTIARKSLVHESKNVAASGARLGRERSDPPLLAISVAAQAVKCVNG